MAELARLRSHSLETRAKISQALIGELNPFFGRKHSIEVINKISAANSASRIYLYNEFKELPERGVQTLCVVLAKRGTSP